MNERPVASTAATMIYYLDGRMEAIRRTTDSQESDLFDVLAYIAYLRPPLKRAERADSRRESILSSYEPRQRDFLDFVLTAI